MDSGGVRVRSGKGGESGGEKRVGKRRKWKIRKIEVQELMNERRQKIEKEGQRKKRMK